MLKNVHDNPTYNYKSLIIKQIEKQSTIERKDASFWINCFNTGYEAIKKVDKSFEGGHFTPLFPIMTCLVDIYTLARIFKLPKHESANVLPVEISIGWFGDYHRLSMKQILLSHFKYVSTFEMNAKDPGRAQLRCIPINKQINLPAILNSHRIIQEGKSKAETESKVEIEPEVEAETETETEPETETDRARDRVPAETEQNRVRGRDRI